MNDDPLDLHAHSLVIDTHADTSQRFIDELWEFTDPLRSGMLSLGAARKGTLAAEFFAIWAEPVQWKGRYAHRTLSLIDGVLEQLRKHPDELQLCLSAEDIRSAYASGRFGVLMGVEGGHSIENDLGLLRCYHRLGVRYMTLTWSNTNEWADSSGDLDDDTVKHHGGLNDFGRDVIREMNRLGMMVDVSHVSDAAFADVLAVSQAPVIASHSSARALTAAPRNLSDDMLKQLARAGGVAMVNFFPAFIDEAWRAAWNGQRAEREAAHVVIEEVYRQRDEPIPYAVANDIDRIFASKLPRVPFSSLIDHIDHVARVAGIEHVGIGSDFDGIPSLPEGMDSAADLPKITAALLQRGYSAEELRLILGENLLRVFAAVQAAADSGSPHR